MPKIPEYQAPLVNIHPSDMGIRAHEAAGYHAIKIGEAVGAMDRETGALMRQNLDQLGRGFEQVGARLTQHQTLQDTLTANDQMTSLWLNWSKQQNAASNDPTQNQDPDFIQNQIDTLKEQGQQIIGNIQTPGGQAHAASLLNEYVRTGITEMMHAENARTLSQADQGTQQNLNQIWAAATRNPTLIPSAMRQTTQIINGTAAALGVPSNQVEEFRRQQQAKYIQEGLGAAISGTMDQNAAQGKQLLDQYGAYLTPRQTETLTNHATLMQAHQDEAARMQASQDRTNNTREVETAVHNAQLQVFRPDGTTDLSGYYDKLQQFQRLPGVGTPGGSEALVSGYKFGREVERWETAGPRTGMWDYRNAQNVINTVATGQPLTVQQMELLPSLSPTMRSFVGKLAIPGSVPPPQEFKQTLDVARNWFLGDQGTNVTPDRLKAWNLYQDAFIRAWESASTTGGVGTQPALSNPKMIFDPKSPSYILKQLGPPEQWLRQNAPQAAPPEPPKPGQAPPPAAEGEGPLGRLWNWFKSFGEEPGAIPNSDAAETAKGAAAGAEVMRNARGDQSTQAPPPVPASPNPADQRNHPPGAVPGAEQ